MGRRPLQFSIRGFMAAIASVALVCSSKAMREWLFSAGSVSARFGRRIVATDLFATVMALGLLLGFASLRFLGRRLGWSVPSWPVSPRIDRGSRVARDLTARSHRPGDLS